MSTAREKFKLLVFLSLSLPWIVRKSGGGSKFSSWLFANLKSSGFRATGGSMISLAALARKNDPSLYAGWLKRGEPSRVSTSNDLSVDSSRAIPSQRSTEVMLFLPVIDIELSAQFVQAFKNDASINGIYLVARNSGLLKKRFEDHDLEFFVECIPLAEIPSNAKLSASCSNAQRNFILMHTPASISSDFLQTCQYHHAREFNAVFCDHDEFVENVRCKPVFKPGYSRELLWDPAYIPVGSVSAGIFDTAIKCTNFNDEGEPTDKGFELINRCFQASPRVLHVPEVKVHLRLPPPSWRKVAQVYNNIKAQPFVDLTQSESSFPEHYVVPSESFKISIIIPTRDRFDLLERCVDSILKFPSHSDFEILILDNQSSEHTTLEGLASYAQLENVSILSCDYEFNWARLTNDGIRAASGDVIVLLNNDTVALTPDWCDRLAWLALEDGVGVAGALLLYPSGAIQHAGVVVGYGGFADHIYIGEPMENRANEMFVSPLVRRDVLACTGACLTFSRETSRVVGEFDEAMVVAGDVDFCLRSYQSGLRNIFDPSIKLLHEESKTRQKGLPERDKEILKVRLGGYIEEGDPFYNANLSLSSRSPMPHL
ncbi:MAG: GT2 family glycosyltransferase [Granulosicoccus sp.]